MHHYLEVESEIVTEKLSAKGNLIRSQTFYLWSVHEKYPTKYVLTLGNQTAYIKGFYLFGIETFMVGRFGDLDIDSYKTHLHPCSQELLKELKKG